MPQHWVQGQGCTDSKPATPDLASHTHLVPALPSSESKMLGIPGASQAHSLAASAPSSTQGAYAMYSRPLTRPNTMHVRQWMGSRLTMKE